MNSGLLEWRQGLCLRRPRAIPGHYVERLSPAPQLADRAFADAGLNDGVGCYAFSYTVGGHHAALEMLDPTGKKLHVLDVQLTPERPRLRVHCEELAPRLPSLALLQ